MRLRKDCQCHCHGSGGNVKHVVACCYPNEFTNFEKDEEQDIIEENKKSDD